MKRINFDLKISESFTGSLRYEKTDYLNDKIVDGKIKYEVCFNQGNIVCIFMEYKIYGENGNPESIFKLIDGNKWNDNFWRKAPEYCHFDDCCWERVGITFDPNPNILTMSWDNWNIVSMVV